MRQNFKFYNGKERKVNVSEGINGRLYITYKQYQRLCKEAEKEGYKPTKGKAYKPFRSETGNVIVKDTYTITV